MPPRCPHIRSEKICGAGILDQSAIAQQNSSVDPSMSKATRTNYRNAKERKTTCPTTSPSLARRTIPSSSTSSGPRSRAAMDCAVCGAGTTMNQFIVHSSLDIVEEVQWGNGQMYVRCYTSTKTTANRWSQVSQVHRSFYQNYVSCWITGGSKPLPPLQPLDKLHPSRAIELYILIRPSRRQIPPPTRAPTCFRQHLAPSTSIGANPTSPQTEEAIKQFFTEVYENWVKTS